MQASRFPRDDKRIIIHFDLDCFYASVVENEHPALKSVPLAIQQKQIIVTCNYEARRRGLYKLQLITDAKRICPDVVIVLGEDISRFRDASKDVYNFLQEQIWSGRAERLGFDEVWLDCTDMVDYNYQLLNHSDLEHSFFCLDKSDPTCGFEFDATSPYGPTVPKRPAEWTTLSQSDIQLRQRLILGSHLAQQIRHELDSQKHYTSTVGIATNKLLSKLVGNVHKPRNQTTLIPPFGEYADGEGSISAFMDEHDIGKIPGIGFKLAQRVRAHVLGRPADHATGLVYGGTKENVTVRDVRLFPTMGPDTLEEILGGPGAQKGIGGKIWGLINGLDDAEVGKVKRVPSQISQEDSYMKYLHTFQQVREQLFLLAERLIRRMQLDLTEEEDDGFDDTDKHQKWLAHPRTLRLSTRPRPPLNADGTRSRTFNRISHSAPLPFFVFSLNESTAALADKLVDKTLVHMFRKLHPERHGWNLSLINIAVTNMAETAADNKDSEGRDIGRMFRRQEDVLKDFKLIEPPDGSDVDNNDTAIEASLESTKMRGLAPTADEWQSDEEADSEAIHWCHVCGHEMPFFAADAHQMFHKLPE